MLSPMYETATYHMSCHREELVSPTYEIGTLLLYHTGEMLSPTYEIATNFMSYGRVSKSAAAYEISIVVMSYEWDMKSYVLNSNGTCVIRMRW